MKSHSKTLIELFLSIHKQLAAEILSFWLYLYNGVSPTSPSLLFAENYIVDCLISIGMTDCGCFAGVPSFFQDIPDILLFPPGEPKSRLLNMITTQK